MDLSANSKQPSQVIQPISIKAKVLLRDFKRVNGWDGWQGIEPMDDSSGVKFLQIEFIPVMSHDHIRNRQSHVQIPNHLRIIPRLLWIDLCCVDLLFLKPFKRPAD